jgi:hypothetical protein
MYCVITYRVLFGVPELKRLLLRHRRIWEDIVKVKVTLSTP